LLTHIVARAEEHANLWLTLRGQLRARAEMQEDAEVALLLRHLARKSETALSGLCPIACALGALAMGANTRGAMYLAGIDLVALDAEASDA
jgi:hypothetical protein